MGRVLIEKMPSKEREIAKRAQALGIRGDLKKALQNTTALGELNKLENELNNDRDGAHYEVMSHFTYNDLVVELEAHFHTTQPDPELVDLPWQDEESVDSFQPRSNFWPFKAKHGHKQIHERIEDPVRCSFIDSMKRY